VRVRQAAELLRRPCRHRVAAQTAPRPAVGWLKPNDPPSASGHRYRLLSPKARALLAEAGYTAQKPAVVQGDDSNSGSGQMLRCR